MFVVKKPDVGDVVEGFVVEGPIPKLHKSSGQQYPIRPDEIVLQA